MLAILGTNLTGWVARPTGFEHDHPQMTTAGEPVVGSSRWIKFILMSGAVIVWQVYDFATVTEAPPPALLALQYGLLVLAVISLVGSIVMLARGRAGRT